MFADTDPAASRALILGLGCSVSQFTCDDGDAPRRGVPPSDIPINICRAVVGGCAKRELRLDPDPSGFGRTDITEQSISVTWEVSRSTDLHPPPRTR